MGRIGAKARAAALTPERRSDIAKRAAQTRWKNRRKAIKAVIVLMLALGCASPALARPSKTLIAWTSAWVGCQAFDTVSTYVALRNPHLREANPILRGPHRYLVKIGVNLGLGVTQYAIVTQEPESKKKFIVPVMMAISGCLAGGLNVRTLRSE